MSSLLKGNLPIFVKKWHPIKIKINNPILNSCWAFSQDLTEKMSQIRANGLKIPFDSLYNHVF